MGSQLNFLWQVRKEKRLCEQVRKACASEAAALHVPKRQECHCDPPRNPEIPTNPLKVCVCTSEEGKVSACTREDGTRKSGDIHV